MKQDDFVCGICLESLLETVPITSIRKTMKRGVAAREAFGIDDSIRVVEHSEHKRQAGVFFKEEVGAVCYQCAVDELGIHDALSAIMGGRRSDMGVLC